MLMLKRTLDRTPRVASIPTPSLMYVPLGQFGQGERKLTGSGHPRALAGHEAGAASGAVGGAAGGAASGAASGAAGGAASGAAAAASSPLPHCAGDELWLWRFLLAGRPFVATGAAAGGPDDGATWLSTAEHAHARRLPRTQMRHRFLAERIAMRWIFGRWFRCPPAQAPVPDATPGASSMACDGPQGRVWIDVAHAGLWLFVALGRGPLALAAHAPAPGGADGASPSAAAGAPDNPLARSRDAAHRLCLARLAGEGSEGVGGGAESGASQGDACAPGADIPLLAHPYVSVPYAGRTRYLYDMSVSSRLTVVVASDSFVHRVCAFGWQN
ncbi:hypothetical protein HUS70_16340 [Pandoraea nosoerga]|uniref:Uncharacterized protein n=1 Tax=Pandoraea nosoerga TaxID=2508296 RepID=A0A5E4X3I3_9BURK|nr:hypothetical protein [Pandoraea nosoerga]MBN4667081.1 hypothetical protein [Pandoraea nosoerga]MBN4676361.1 hypothetical protein [Pandoraea nosoerga]MBN4681399.1 hypothetical protein [Pandoraea nosoerga]MBN4746186.1 hypothetical protein [Pandoraea nosoerga]VVE30849.1 hypothetical protein PNO31109_03626 [Pandoraea nosoerga]